MKIITKSSLCSTLRESGWFYILMTHFQTLHKTSTGDIQILDQCSANVNLSCAILNQCLANACTSSVSNWQNLFLGDIENEMKWIGFRPPLCTCRLNWARRASWGWWDEWNDTVLQTQDSKFEPWRSQAEHATSRSRRLPTILSFTRGWRRKICVSFKPPRPGTEPRTPSVKGSGANHYPRAPALGDIETS